MRRTFVRDRIRVQIHFANGYAGGFVINRVDSIVEQELGFPLLGVHFDGHSNGGTNDEAISRLFDQHQIPLIEA